MTVALSQVDDGGHLPPSFMVLVSSDPQERGRIAAALDGEGVVVMVPDAGVAVALLQRAEEAAHGLTEASMPSPVDVVRIDDLVVDRSRAEVLWRGRPVVVSHLELEVLACLASAPGEVWNYERLHEAAWGSRYLGDRDSLHSLVKRLRRKLTSAGVTTELLAVRGVGFQLVRPSGRAEPDLALAGGAWPARPSA
jgi:DNA-binding winged helix-turn-helix (wHTH) protein